LRDLTSEGEERVEEKCLDESVLDCMGAGVPVVEGELDLFEEWSLELESGIKRD
jgi:hypothetical protein